MSGVDFANIFFLLKRGKKHSITGERYKSLKAGALMMRGALCWRLPRMRRWCAYVCFVNVWCVLEDDWLGVCAAGLPTLAAYRSY